jgi:hypothetical protein
MDNLNDMYDLHNHTFEEKVLEVFKLWRKLCLPLPQNGIDEK